MSLKFERLETFRVLSLRKKLMLLPALCALCVARITLALLPFSTVRSLFDRLPAIWSLPPTTLLELRWAVTALSRTFPRWNSCLYRSAAFGCLCRLGGFPVSLQIGAHAGSEAFKAHAWLENARGEVVMEEVAEDLRVFQ